jgi:DnaK suppressor protein
MVNEQVLNVSPSFDTYEYISEEMLTYFKEYLQKKHEEILQKEEAISFSLLNEPIRMADSLDQSSSEEIHHEDFMIQEHEDYLRHEIESALQRIEEGTFGYCEETGDPIGLKRLIAVPYARYCLKVQEHKEQAVKRMLG